MSGEKQTVPFGGYRVLLLLLILSASCAVVAGLSIVLLYRASLAQARERLVESAKSQARLIEAVAEHEKHRFERGDISAFDRDSALEETLDQLRTAHRQFRGFGETGEFTLAQEEGDRIRFLLSHRHEALGEPAPVPMTSDLAEPMRRALQGRSGTLVGLDYRGETVLAAHEPVKFLECGIVAKIDLSEVRAPFFRAAMIAGGIALLVVGAGALLFLRISNPMIRRLEQSAETLKTEVKQRRQSEATLFEYIQNAPDGILVCDAEHRFLMANPAAAKLLGHSVEDLTRLSVTDLVLPEARDAMFAGLEELRTTGTAGAEPTFVRADGSHIRVSVKAVQLDEDRCLAFWRDISVRKAAEDALACSEDRYRAVSGLTSDYAYSYRVEADGSIQNEWVTGAMARITGFAPEEVAERGGWESLVLERDLSVPLGQLKKVLRGEDAAVEYRIRTRGGEVRWMRDFAQPVWDEGEGRVVRIYGAVQDITERRRVEDALRESESAYRGIFEQAAVGIVYSDLDGRFVRVNRKMCDIVGYSPEELSGLRFHDITHPEDLGANVAQLENLIAGEIDTFSMEKRYLQKDGGDVWVHLTVSLLRDAEDVPLHAVGVIEDITSRKMLEAQLRQAQKLEAIGQLAGGVAHDFNNLLQAIFTHVDVSLSSQPTPKRVVEHLEGIRGSAERAAELTHNLLAFSRKQHLVTRNVDLNHLISGHVKMLGRIIRADIELKFEPHPDPLVIQADPGQIEQVLLNLCLNARDAMPDGGSLRLETGLGPIGPRPADSVSEVSPGDHAWIRVSDTGEGMTEDVRRRVFEPFFTTKALGKGTGLGLSTVYGIVKQHNGWVFASCAPESGASFEVYLPVTGAAPEETVLGSMEEAPGGTETVLLAEDEESVRDLAVEVLEGAGYRVISAGDGREALELFEARQKEIDLAVLDVVMPRMGGREACTRMRELRPDFPILFSSGYSADIVRGSTQDAGDMQLIQKPYAVNELLRRIRSLLVG